MKRLYVRPELCTGCKTCELACAVEHSRSKNLLGAMMESPPPHLRLYVEAVVDFPFEVLKMPMTCRHCDPAPCIAACIPQAMHRSPDDVVTNVGGKHACIACGMCIMMCPFGMIARAPSTGRQDHGAESVISAPTGQCPPARRLARKGRLCIVEGDEFAHQSRQRASAVLGRSSARQVREATLVRQQEE